MSTVRLLHLSLLLSLTSACTIDKDLLSGGSGDDASESAEATSAPTGDATEATTGEPGMPTSTGSATSIDTDADDTGSATTTGADPEQSQMILFGVHEAKCMPVCVADKDPSTTPLDPACQMFEVDVETQAQEEMVPCDRVNDQWVIPASQERCYAEIIDPGDQTPSKVDDMSDTCLGTGFNLEFEVVATKRPPGLVLFGVICELSANVERDCPDA